MRHAQLKAFHAVARHGGFSKAAERLNLTQPAVSGHVRNLEETYGVQLVKRGPSGISLTATGRKLYALAERQFEIEAEAQQLLSRARNLDEGELKLGADAAVHALPLIAKFRASYPGIAIKLEAGNSLELIARLEAFEIDAAIASQPPSSDELAGHLLRQNRLAAIVPVPQAAKPKIAFAEFAKLPLILREEGSVTRRLLEEELRRRGLAPIVTLEIETREAAREAVAQGLGAAVMSESELVPDARIAVVKFSDWPAEMQEWLIVLKSRRGLQLIRALWKLAQ